MANGTITVTSAKVSSSGGVRSYAIAWVSDAGGLVSQTLSLPAGSVIKTITVPAGGGVAPTGTYAWDLKDANGISYTDDGTGTTGTTSQSTTVSTVYVPFMHGKATTSVTRVWLDPGTYTFSVSGAGASKQGTVTLYMTVGPL